MKHEENNLRTKEWKKTMKNWIKQIETENLMGKLLGCAYYKILSIESLTVKIRKKSLLLRKDLFYGINFVRRKLTII